MTAIAPDAEHGALGTLATDLPIGDARTPEQPREGGPEGMGAEYAGVRV